MIRLDYKPKYDKKNLMMDVLWDDQTSLYCKPKNEYDIEYNEKIELRCH